MQVELKKQAKKYLAKCTKCDCVKISNAIEKLKNLQGDIKKLQGRTDEYRLKIPPFRVVFEYDRVNKVILVTKIDTRGDIYKKG